MGGSTTKLNHRHQQPVIRECRHCHCDFSDSSGNGYCESCRRQWCLFVPPVRETEHAAEVDENEAKIVEGLEMRVVTVRMPDELHAELKRLSGGGRSQADSINTICVGAIEREVERRKGIDRSDVGATSLVKSRGLYAGGSSGRKG